MGTGRSVPKSATNDHPSTEAEHQQRTWTAAEKLAILAEYESYPRGDPRRGELLRRVGAYSSHMSKWRDQRDRGTLTSKQHAAAGRPLQPRDPQQEELTRLRVENARLQAELHKATTVIEVQKKIATLLGTIPASPPSGEA